ncbi:MAG: DUF11 domain-containing protein, partial [Gammaproteobacteria bacterium]|nr:DUF11 domain-containing protein [Gammaproteobacteria bacterium]
MLIYILQLAFSNRVARAPLVDSLSATSSSVDINAEDVSSAQYRFGFLLLLFFVLSLAMASPAQAAQTPCSAIGGLLDGNVTPVPPANIKIDANCRIQNYPGGLNTNFSFDNNDPTPYLVIFDNVSLTGNMSCNVVAGHKIWFTNNATTTLSASCQSILIPVEKIDKQNPVGQTTATIGVPFTYIMTIPVLFDPGTGNVALDGSVNDLGNIHISDDLSIAGTSANGTVNGADLTLLDVIAYEKGTGITVPINNIGGNNLDFTLPNIAANDQIIVEVTVVLNDTAANVAGNTFINTAKWEFSRLIDNQFFSPLPGENGITLPLTIAEPNLVVTKSNPDTVLNVGILSTFTIDVQNNGGSDAWNVSIFDQFPDGATAGMCDYDPTSGAGITAQVFDSLGTNPVSPVLIQGVDFSATYRDATVNPPSTRCQLEIDMLSSAAVIGPTQRLIITYQTQLDANTTAQGALLINVAGAVGWYGDDPANNPRQYTRSITDGTPLIADHEDSYTIITALSGYVFHKTVENRTTGANPTATAAPGDVLRYRLRLFNVDQNFTAISIIDQLSTTQFDLTTFNMITIPGNAEFTYSNVTGQLNIDGLGAADLNLPIGSELIIEFDLTLQGSPPLANNDIVLNQADLTSNTVNALSDDPAGGIVPPGDPGESTQVVIQAPGPLSKVNDQAEATIGEQFTYTILVPATPVLVPLYDVRILDDLAASNADLSFVSASVVSGGSWSLTNTSGSNTNLVIEDIVTGIDIPSLGQAEIRITVEMLNTGNNNGVPQTSFNNTASYTYNRTNGVNASQVTGGGDTTADMTVVEPALTGVTKVGTQITAGPLSGGSIIEYVLTMNNDSDSTAFNINIVDNLPPELALDASFVATATITGVPVVGFDPVPGPGPLPGQWIWGQGNGDGTLDLPVSKTLVLTYRVQVQTSAAATFNNIAWIDWLSLETGAASVRTGLGCPTITAPDDYCVTAIGNVFNIIDDNSLSKVAIADSWTTDGSTAIDKTVRVGDTVTYRLTMNLGEGTLNSVTVSDLLPAGMAFDSLVSITPAANFNFTLASQPANGDTGNLVWDFGTVINTPSGDGTPIDSIVIEYVATVLPNVGIAQVPTLSLDNTATLGYVDGAGVPVTDPLRLEATESVTLLQPVMTTV